MSLATRLGRGSSHLRVARAPTPARPYGEPRPDRLGRPLSEATVSVTTDRQQPTRPGRRGRQPMTIELTRPSPDDSSDSCGVRPSIRVVSFFAGIGGFDYGFEQAGMRTVWQCEKKEFCLDILEKHWPDVPRAKDIQGVNANDIPDAEIWTGGFPCQDVSLARMGPRSGLRGEQSGLFYDFAQLIGSRRPQVVVLENVAALLSSHDGRDFAVILRTLADIGYGLAWRVLDSRYFGIPQSRTRVFIVGTLGDPTGAGQVLFEPECGDRDFEKSRSHGKKSVSPFAISVGNNEQGFVKKLAHCLYAESARHTGTDWSRNYVSYPKGRVRRLTPLETERLQGFPDGWTMPTHEMPNQDSLDSARYHACGNAVSVPVAEWIGKRIVETMGDERLLGSQNESLNVTPKSA